MRWCGFCRGEATVRASVGIQCRQNHALRFDSTYFWPVRGWLRILPAFRPELRVHSGALCPYYGARCACTVVNAEFQKFVGFFFTRSHVMTVPTRGPFCRNSSIVISDCTGAGLKLRMSFWRLVSTRRSICLELLHRRFSRTGIPGLPTVLPAATGFSRSYRS